MIKKLLLLTIVLSCRFISTAAAGYGDTLSIITAFTRLYAHNTQGFAADKGALISEKNGTRTSGLNFPLVPGYRGYIIESSGEAYALLEFLMPNREDATTMYGEAIRMIKAAANKRFSSSEKRDEKNGSMMVYNSHWFFEDLQDSILTPASKWYHWKITMAKPATENFYVITITIKGKPERIALKPDPGVETKLDKVISKLFENQLYGLSNESLYGIKPETSAFVAGYDFAAPNMNLTQAEAEKLYQQLKTILTKKATGKFSKKEETDYPLWKSKKTVFYKSVKDTDKLSFSITIELNKFGKTGVTLTIKVEDGEEWGI